MARSPGFGSTTTYYFALLRLAFASAPSLQLNLARYRNSPVHSAKGTPSPVNGLWLFVSIRFQVLFHSPSGVLFTFPSRYWFTIGHLGVFSLAGWSPRIPTRFLVSRCTQDTSRFTHNFRYRALTFFGWLSQVILLLCNNTTSRSYNPSSKAGLGSSRFARRYSGNRFFFLFLQLLRYFNSLRYLLIGYIFTYGY